MPRKWSRGVSRIQYEGIDGEYDRLKKTVKAHELHDGNRRLPLPRPSRDSSGLASTTANTPQKRRWGR